MTCPWCGTQVRMMAEAEQGPPGATVHGALNICATCYRVSIVVNYGPFLALRKPTPEEERDFDLPELHRLIQQLRAMETRH
jgi:hypothetical protein